jgi:hypothetical protein
MLPIPFLIVSHLLCRDNGFNPPSPFFTFPQCDTDVSFFCQFDRKIGTAFAATFGVRDKGQNSW